ncbi:MAG: hypothetical protein U5R30_07070 [Deltaproteobacteria bacterium]|nr:hypothetical protein [Deltaproteobacteria bacterium]
MAVSPPWAAKGRRTPSTGTGIQGAARSGSALSFAGHEKNLHPRDVPQARPRALMTVPVGDEKSTFPNRGEKRSWTSSG